MEDKIFKHLMGIESLIISIIKLLKKHDYISTIKWCMGSSDTYYKNEKYKYFYPISIYPTI